MAVNEEQVRSALEKVIDPDKNQNAVELGLVTGISISEGIVDLSIPAVNSRAGVAPPLLAEIKKAVILLPGVKQVLVNGSKDTASPNKPAERPNLTRIKKIIAVASAKGGVGKSTVSVNLAAALSKLGYRVGLLDADIYGPNLPLMAGAEGAEPTVAVYTDQQGNQQEFIEPIQSNGLKVMSMGFLVHPGQPIMWRGPMLNTALRQFLGQVDWGDLDYLVIDLPPGTGDVQLSLLQMVPVSGIIHITTPQEVALQDVRRGVTMFEMQKVPVIGIIENMSFFRCPHCGEDTDIFSAGGGLEISETMGVPLLAQIPINIKIRQAADLGFPIALNSEEQELADIFIRAAERIHERIGSLGDASTPVTPSTELPAGSR